VLRHPAADSARGLRAPGGMRAHLDGCPACREDYHSLRALAAQTDQASSGTAGWRLVNARR
jgi:hypothetical protein